MMDNTSLIFKVLPLSPSLPPSLFSLPFSLSSYSRMTSFPGPAQLSVISSTVRWERAWYLPHVSDIRIERGW